MLVEVSDNVVDIDARRVQRPPSARGLARREALRAAEAAYQEADPVVRAARHASHGELLHVQVVELAREAASLKFDRLQTTDPRTRQRITSRRIRALRALADAVIQRHRHEAGAPSDAAVQRVLQLLMSDVLAVGPQIFSSDVAAKLQVALQERFDARLEQMTGLAR